MATITVRNLDDEVKVQLRIRAARHGRSMEDEVRAILREAIRADDTPRLNMAQAIRRHVEPLGGVDLELPVRGPMRKLPKFE